MKINQENKTIINNLATAYFCKVFFSCLSVRARFSKLSKTIDYISLATYARLNLTKYIKNRKKLFILMWTH